MPSRIRYMGNKHEVAPIVARLVRRRSAERMFLDLFCGMCSVAGSIAHSGRTVVGNDVQSYAVLVAECLLASPEMPPSQDRINGALRRSYLYNEHQLLERFGGDVEREHQVIAASDARGYRRLYDAWRHAANDQVLANEVMCLSAAPTRGVPYRLATLCFAWGYFGLRQAIAIDSIRYAIDRGRADGHLTSAEASWALVALLQAASCAAATTGHFAQYLRPSTPEGLVRIIRQRRRGIWSQFLRELKELRPYGSAAWRTKNRILQSDALDVWGSLDEIGFRDGVVYADPPYSKDHYSRYYHVLETLTLYDYPNITGKGRYRSDRFVTPFSLKSRVHSAMDRLAAAAAARNCTLILSYPSNGLLNADCGIDPETVLQEHFKTVIRQRPIKTNHSTLGARHGVARNSVHELLWIAD